MRTETDQTIRANCVLFPRNRALSTSNFDAEALAMIYKDELYLVGSFIEVDDNCAQYETSLIHSKVNLRDIATTT